jgi:hypothetical protein
VALASVGCATASPLLAPARVMRDGKVAVDLGSAYSAPAWAPSLDDAQGANADASTVLRAAVAHGATPPGLVTYVAGRGGFGHSAEGSIALIGRVVLARHFHPPRWIDGREMGISRHGGVHPGQVQIGGLVHGQAIDFAATNDAQLLCPRIACSLQRLLDRSHRLHALERHLATAGQHQVQAARQGATERLRGPAPHQDRLADGQRLEALEIVRQLPWQVVVTTDTVPGVERSDQRELHAQTTHTATGALIAGCGS